MKQQLNRLFYLSQFFCGFFFLTQCGKMEVTFWRHIVFAKQDPVQLNKNHLVTCALNMSICQKYRMFKQTADLGCRDSKTLHLEQEVCLFVFINLIMKILCEQNVCSVVVSDTVDKFEQILILIIVLLPLTVGLLNSVNGQRWQNYTQYILKKLV